MDPFLLPNMSCHHCARVVTHTVHGIDPTSIVTIDVQSRTLEIVSDVDRDVFARALDSAGYHEA